LDFLLSRLIRISNPFFLFHPDEESTTPFHAWPQSSIHGHFKRHRRLPAGRPNFLRWPNVSPPPHSSLSSRTSNQLTLLVAEINSQSFSFVLCDASFDFQSRSVRFNCPFLEFIHLPLFVLAARSSSGFFYDLRNNLGLCFF